MKQKAPKVNLQKAEAVAQFVGLTTRRIYQLTDAGILPVVDTPDGNRYDFNDTIRKYIKYLQGLAAGKEVNLSEAEVKKRKTEADTKYREAKAKKAELELKEFEGKLYKAEDIKAVISDMVYAMRGAMLALPARLAIDVANAQTPAEASAIIKAEVDKVLRELTNYEYDPQKFKERSSGCNVVNNQGINGEND